MQNLSQNELNQITKIQNQSRDELEQIAELELKTTKKCQKKS